MQKSNSIIYFMQLLIHSIPLVNIGNLTFVFQYCQNMQIKYLSGKRLVLYQLSKSGKTISTSRTGTYCAAWDTSWSSGFLFLVLWLRQSTGTWFLHVETGKKTISSVQIYSDNLHSRRRDRTSVHFSSPWTHYLQTPPVIIQMGVLFSHQNTQIPFHFTAQMSLGPVCHPGPSSHSLCKTSTSSATLLLSFYCCCPTCLSRYTAAPVWHYLNTNPSKKPLGLKSQNSILCNLWREIYYISLWPVL